MRTLRAEYGAHARKEVFRIADLSDAQRDPAVKGYLAAANFEIVDLAPTSALHANLAHYPKTSLAITSTPPIEIEWRRDEASTDRMLMVFARRGELAASSEGPLLRRGSTALLVPPGAASVRIRTTQPQNELIYISAGAHLVPAAVSRVRHDVIAPALPWRRIAPLYAFVQGVCASPPSPSDEPDLLGDTTNSIVEALARQMFWDIAPLDGIVPQAQAFIEEHHSNPRVNASAIAAHLRVPMRTLQAAFATEGLTIRAELRRVRTESAVGVLQRHPRISQAQRAQLAGFASLSAMYRALQAAGHGSGAVPVDVEPPAFAELVSMA